MAQHGDRGALEELVRRYQERIRRIVRVQLGASKLRRDYESMDIVQSTFAAALPRLRDLQPRSAAGLLSWLALIATNQIRDLHDRQHSSKRDIAREQPIESEALGSKGGVPLAMTAAAPDEQALMNELRDLLDDEVARLPDDQRRVVLLRDYYGESWERIAEELGRDNGAARQLHQRARIKLRSALSPKLASRPQ